MPASLPHPENYVGPPLNYAEKTWVWWVTLWLFCSCCCFHHVVQGCEITQNPRILTLLLQRFSFDYKYRCYVKLHCKVDVPQTLHMEVCFYIFIYFCSIFFNLTFLKSGDFILPPFLQNCKYDLYALVNHFGNLIGGHYTAQIKSFENKEWYHFNDDIVAGVRRLIFWYVVQFQKFSHSLRFNNMKFNTFHCDIFIILQVKQPLFGSGDKSLRSSTAYLLMYRKGRFANVQYYFLVYRFFFCSVMIYLNLCI